MMSRRTVHWKRRAAVVVAAVVAVSATAGASPAAGDRRDPAGPTGAAEAAGGAVVVGEKRIGPRVVDLTVRSPALGGTGRVRLLTPDGWDGRRPGDRWPVLYLLAGGDGDYGTFTREYRLQDVPELRDTLVVMPEMPFFGFYSDWWNGGGGGAPGVQAFHLDEVRPLLERDYGAGARRAVAGESQGGYGAVKYAALRPGMFRAAASYSGFLNPLKYPEAVIGGAEFVGIDWRRIWGDPVEQRRIWERNDPYHLAERLRGTPVYIASGDGTRGELDQDAEPDPVIPGLQDLAVLFPTEVVSLTEAVMGDESRAVAYRLREVGAPVTAHFYRGTHDPRYWKRELLASLPMLLERLGGPHRPDGDARP
ncbi:alpha/beta hydrolase [Actinomadura rifamycini]|uniref:alpha/beta hydrolase n=1 Tax=Actinomadura rifamycini TaxID=31962 RepID=UPI0007E8BE0D|nr:alpha/beta hydrolase-fold protein [Actinomadura rifamycini]